jgi:hypothetical protein
MLLARSKVTINIRVDAQWLGLSKNTVLDIVKRDRAAWRAMTMARMVELTSVLRAPAMAAIVAVIGRSNAQSANCCR